MPSHRPVMLVILDGWGHRVETADNAVALARTPTVDRLKRDCPHALLMTSGGDVGLPGGQMGNSEVGHLNIGAGRVVMQELPRIDHAIETGELARNPVVLELIAALKKSGGVCHLAGLISDGGVHSHQRHAVALAQILTAAGITTVVHVLTDGRDTPPKSAAGFVADFVAALPVGVSIATVIGRFYAMDRDNRWARVETAYAAMTDAAGARFATATAAVASAYAESITDEFIKPAVIGDYAGLSDGDALLFFNFRSDRMREIVAAFVDPTFKGFPRSRVAKTACVVSMTEYDAAMRGVDVLFPAQTAGQHVGGIRCAPRPDAVADGGDGEVSARHVFPQWRQRDAVSGRASHHGAIAEGRHL